MIANQTAKMPPRHIAGFAELAAQYDVLLCDVWGVVHDGTTHIPAAGDALTRFRARGGIVVLLTNAPRPGPSVGRMLDRFGVPRSAYDAIVSSGDISADLIVARGNAPLHHIGAPRDMPLFKAVAVRTGREPDLVPLEQADYAVCTGILDEEREPQISDPELAIMRARNMALICANPDIVVHVGDALLWCAGALARCYAQLGGEVIMAGKPHAIVYETAMRKAEALRGTAIERSRVLAIGDGFFTDIAGAAGQQIDALFITGGVHRDALHPQVTASGVADEAAMAMMMKEAGFGPSAFQQALVW